MHEQFNWETHHQVMQQVVTFLEDNQMIPSQLSIKADGWTEVQFTVSNGKSEIRQRWEALHQRKAIEIAEPILEVETRWQTSVHVKFRINENNQPTRWQRIRQLVS